MIEKVKTIASRISMNALGTDFKIRIENDIEYQNGRLFLQIIYKAPCTKTGKITEWHGRKYYLSKYMTDDEIIKTAYAAFESCVKHEVMEGFKVDDIILFNPHVDFNQLLLISKNEVSRY